ncbi:MAG: hypothetical protein IID51_06285 [Proteobacteria bacterium]|nr:hypothetical protein [Pseudomonadota bacterium]
MAIFGTLHLLYSMLDLAAPKRFAPKDESLLGTMKNTRIRMARNARNFRLSYMGFHLSHSLGLIMFAAIYMALSIIEPAVIFSAPLAAIMIGVGVTYAALSHFFWFVIPLAGSILATALLALGLMVH